MPAITIPLFKVFMAENAHADLKRVLFSGHLGAGPQVQKFETAIAAALGTRDAVGLSDASSALQLALYMAGVRPGDEVITSPLACSASVMPIVNLFAQPIWCDVDPTTGMPDSASVQACLSKKTRAILIYDWAGDAPALGPLYQLAQQHGLTLIEDASEAWGAKRTGQSLGAEADFTVYSFYATKPLNTGEGAVLLAADPAKLSAARNLRRFGIEPGNFRLKHGDLNPAFDIPLAGFNCPMNEIAATLGLANQAHAQRNVARHRANGRFYGSALAGVPGIQLLRRRSECGSAYWVYSLLADRRDELIRKLVANGIGSQRLHLRNDAYTCFGRQQQRPLPGVAHFDAFNLAIPCGWWVNERDRERIVDCIRGGW